MKWGLFNFQNHLATLLSFSSEQEKGGSIEPPNDPWIYPYTSTFNFNWCLFFLIQCVPQIYLHFKTKSTKGWHVLGVWGDFTGGVFSVVQMLLCCIIDHDNAQLTGNIPKLILSTECLCFDAVFIFQHYIFYNYSNYRQEELTTKPLIINSEEQRSYDTFAKRLGY